CEQAIVLQQENNFSYVCCLYDNYEGWCMSNQLAEIPAVPASELKGYIHQHGNTALINNNTIKRLKCETVFLSAEGADFTECCFAF
ncbi:MAG TPA: hypothetical protein VN958_10285, partial [Chitinophagaceae bacterium]|nr:hypothetical protein [Chitinophagaceae bacterium]